VFSGARIGRITPHGQITEFSLPATIDANVDLTTGQAITAGPDGNLWFVDGLGAGHEPSIVGKITPSGSVTFPIPKTQNYHLLYTQNYRLVSLDDITVGTDGNLWITGSTSPNGVPTVLPPKIPNGTTNLGGIIMRMTL
jgi:streptogramin lyase